MSALADTALGQIFTGSIEGQIIDLKAERIYSGAIKVEEGIITSVSECQTTKQQYLIPPLIDAHMHVESTLCTPAHAGAALMAHGVLGCVSDPHEIANVLGIPGIEYMLKDAERTVWNVLFGAPSCVPATNSSMETAGAVLDSVEIAKLLAHEKIGYLAEVMNFPGVLNDDPDLLKKIAAAKRFGKPIDGHAPGLTGEDAIRYAAHGISTDHECFTLPEALHKILQADQFILIREGSAARNLDALAQIVDMHPDRAMLCTDDLHPDLALSGSINRHVIHLLKLGIDPLKIFRAASSNPNQHYKMGLGQLQKGDPADFIVVQSLKDFYVQSALRKGKVVGKDGMSAEQHAPSPIINKFATTPISSIDLKVPASGRTIRVIDVIDGQLVTGSSTAPALIKDNQIISDLNSDILKIAVVNRYNKAPVSVGFVRNFGLKQGALASSVAHDCHNIIAVGTNDQDLTNAINNIIENKGGLSFVSGNQVSILPLPVAGLMSNEDLPTTARKYADLDRKAKELGQTPLRAPFMTLSFLGLIVIPKLKLSDLGLFEDFAQKSVVID